MNRPLNTVWWETCQKATPTGEALCMLAHAHTPMRAHIRQVLCKWGAAIRTVVFKVLLWFLQRTRGLCRQTLAAHFISSTLIASVAVASQWSPTTHWPLTPSPQRAVCLCVVCVENPSWRSVCEILSSNNTITASISFTPPFWCHSDLKDRESCYESFNLGWWNWSSSFNVWVGPWCSTIIRVW